jgi:hypothetical protein
MLFIALLYSFILLLFNKASTFPLSACHWLSLHWGFLALRAILPLGFSRHWGFFVFLIKLIVHVVVLISLFVVFIALLQNSIVLVAII